MEEIRRRIGEILDDGTDNKDKLEQIMSLMAENRQIPLKSLDDGEIEWANISEVWFAESRNNAPVYGYNNRLYVQSANKSDLGKLFRCVGESIIKANNSSYLNCDHVRKYDSYKQLAYFEEEVNDKSLKLEINMETAVNVLPKLIGKENDLDKGESLYSSKFKSLKKQFSFK